MERLEDEPVVVFLGFEKKRSCIGPLVVNSPKAALHR